MVVVVVVVVVVITLTSSRRHQQGKGVGPVTQAFCRLLWLAAPLRTAAPHLGEIAGGRGWCHSHVENPSAGLKEGRLWGEMYELCITRLLMAYLGLHIVDEISTTWESSSGA